MTICHSGWAAGLFLTIGSHGNEIVIHLKNYTAAIFFSSILSSGSECHCFRWGICFHIFFPTQKSGGFSVVFRIWYVTIARIIGDSILKCIVYFHNTLFQCPVCNDSDLRSSFCSVCGLTNPINRFPYRSLVSVVRLHNFRFASIVAEFS